MSTERSEAGAAPGDATGAELPVLWPGVARSVWIGDDGVIDTLDNAAALRRALRNPPLVCHLQAARRRLRSRDLAGLDVLELFAFVHPARFVLPTPRGLAEFLRLAPPRDAVEEALVLPEAVQVLCDDLADDADTAAGSIARAMHLSGWGWAPLVLEVLGIDPADVQGFPEDHQAWSQLQEWSESGPEAWPGSEPVTAEESVTRLGTLLGPQAESRPGQVGYAAAAAGAFLPRERQGAPKVVLAEAGTGVGKTLAYIAPASIWAERNRGTVWISTYTRNLQQQIDGELDRMYPDPVGKARNVVVRKGRENYLCLLNLEETTRSFGRMPGSGAALGLMARWTMATRDGDLSGGDFPAWLADLMEHRDTLGLADRRGECIHSLCRHHDRCFVEKSARMARRARLVIANHALVMSQAASAIEVSRLPTRYIFDEGHHLFDAADSAFSLHLSGREAAHLRSWLAGGGSRRTRTGVLQRSQRLTESDPGAGAVLERVRRAVGGLPDGGWLDRIEGDQPAGPAELFLARVRGQVLARNQGSPAAYSMETHLSPPVDGLIEAADALHAVLDALAAAMAALSGVLARVLDTEAAVLEAVTRSRIAVLIRLLDQRRTDVVVPWCRMLEILRAGGQEGFIDRFEISCAGGRVYDVGMHRHWIDPTRPLHGAVFAAAHGAIVTSASLRDASGDDEADWKAAEARTGLHHLPEPAHRARFDSPFDYAERTRVFIVVDVERDDPDQVAAAYRELFLAANGGSLGLFTAVARLRATYARIAEPLDQAGVTLYAQHVDGLDVSTLVRIFRAEENACLLGTDAVRDGVDVPGRSLRLIAFDRVPWPVPGIVHTTRRAAFGGRDYDDMLVRLKLRQAFGRLLRRESDKGVFVMLDRRMPGRFRTAFPDATPVARCGLAEAIGEIRQFLAPG